MIAKFTQSIRWKYAVTFAGVMAALIVLIWLLFSVFLQSFYYSEQQRTMERARVEFQQVWAERRISQAERRQTLIAMCDKYNMSFLMLASNGEALFTSYTDHTRLAEHLEDYIFNQTEPKDAKILKQEDDYVLCQVYDRKYASSYLECMGYFPIEGVYRPYIISFPLVAIDESVKMANEFYIYVGVTGIVLSAFIAFWITRRITKPILELTAISQRMSRLEFDARYQGMEENEIGILGNNINHLSETLERTISELKTANYELRKDNELKTQLDVKRREFLANVSHELKTPIALVQGYAEGLEEIGDDPESRAYYCNVIIDEAEKMNRLVMRLINLNQIEEHGDQVEMSRLNMTELIGGVLRASEVLCQQKNAVLCFDEENPVYVWGDPFQIEEVMTNYFSNALNHLDGERKITITQDILNEKTVRITVYNTGKQIPEEDLTKIWEKFYKVDKAHTREYGGSGIGLSIVKAILDSMSQAYGVENRADGVAFWFTLDKA